MIVIGLTGTSGSGKGTVCNLFLKYGIHSIDADSLVHSLYSYENDCTREIAANFGDILTNEKSVDRAKLRNIVFKDKVALNKLNLIVHKYVQQACVEKIEKLASSGCAAMIIDAPQLFESGIDKICDITVAVVANRDIRFERIISRDLLSGELVNARFDNQFSDDFFKQKCDYVIENNGDKSDLERAVADFVIKRGLVSNECN